MPMVVAGLTVAKYGCFADGPAWDHVAYSWMLALLGGVLLVAAVAFWYLKRWQQRTREDRAPSADQLTHFRELYEEGELSSEEFARIRGLLADRMIRELDKAPAPVHPPPEPPRPPNPTS
jgi:hypothetical protein